ncbi:LpxL/LpxP family Kdo(2)-lipid IV(A) lauroyl/palmitoleoyl acyltransferase [Aurantivibrio plasticivorans]
MDTKSQPRFSLALFHPRYWVTWLLFLLWFAISQLPYAVHRVLAAVLSVVFYYVAPSRRRVAERNLELCFPELSEFEREQLLKANFYSTAMAVFESGMAWFWPRARIQGLVQVEGLEILREHQATGQGAIILSLHFTTLEIWGATFSSNVDKLDMTYRPHRNKVYDYLQHRARGRADSSDVVAAGDVRSMVKKLKQGRFVAYFPDQDYGKNHSVFAPFFGVQAATVTAMARMAKMAKVPVIPVMCARKPGIEGYKAWVMPAWENYPSADDVENATYLNAHVEKCVRMQPDQYLWVHRRFKTRPEGEGDLYRKTDR